jgi:hypothetical protein
MRGKKCCAEQKLLVSAYCLFFVGGGLGKAGKILLIPRWQQQQQHLESIHPSIHPSHQVMASAV